MRELSLFSGAGGGLLGTKLMGWKHVGYVEWNEYCQRVIAARIADGYLDEAPIFTDVREFVQSGAADQYRGIADVVSAGFPCQPFSVAGEQLAEADERNMWPATKAIIRAVRPKHLLLENVPALLTSGYFGVILSDLAEMGFVGRWGCIPASTCGAPPRARPTLDRCPLRRNHGAGAGRVCQTIWIDCATTRRQWKQPFQSSMRLGGDGHRVSSNG